ncbi:MAG: hypothetical protein AB9891_18170 [Anaerolineaceae bacterium]
MSWPGGHAEGEVEIHQADGNQQDGEAHSPGQVEGQRNQQQPGVLEAERQDEIHRQRDKGEKQKIKRNDIHAVD